MLRSMTGFGRKESVYQDLRVTVEMRAVNHRFCEVVVRLPKSYAVLEDQVKKIVGAKVQRGRVDITISLERQAVAQKTVAVDWELAEQYVQLSREATIRLAVEGRLSIDELFAMPGVLTTAEPEQLAPEEIAEWVSATVSEATDDLLLMREREGERLLADFKQRLQKIERCAEEIHTLSPTVVEEHRSRLLARIAEWKSELKQEFEEQRVMQEILLLAERSDITEELTRLSSHCVEFGNQLNGAEAVGRRLDFLLQEMNREANTICSKANHVGISHLAVEIKAELEKMREQVQNIE
ncbi:YicC family protein [Brevibacillus fluminis]|uniref:YicC family protein n=1 Tax=Brevibacillus fluminis TaxID=511487 RepID=A0A3M8DUZ9_9BACL|nr:YicC/YloC family endoribonuclease [Brevibacillus fluminis]RNB91201.1 YicC family protein [Brevibacillus fluminis]